MPHRNNVPSLASRRPDQHNEAIGKEPVGLKPLFAIIEAVIALRQRRPRKDRRRILKIETAFLQRRMRLAG
jgi:hypothetical protein